MLNRKFQTQIQEEKKRRGILDGLDNFSQKKKDKKKKERVLGRKKIPRESKGSHSDREKKPKTRNGRMITPRLIGEPVFDTFEKSANGERIRCDDGGRAWIEVGGGDKEIEDKQRQEGQAHAPRAYGYFGRF